MKFWLENVSGRDHWKDLDVNGIVINIICGWCMKVMCWAGSTAISGFLECPRFLIPVVDC
jgi:hypothetical protein